MSATEDPPIESAQQTSQDSLTEVLAALADRRNFKLEAGAGSGKTHTLIQALDHILANRTVYLPRRDQRVACLTYTKVARDEIIARTDQSFTIFADTLHGFLWEMIRPYQKALRVELSKSEAWEEALAVQGIFTGAVIDYDLGIRSIDEERVSLHHDDIPALAIELFRNTKFRSLIKDRFPVIFIDEYQDTPEGLAEAMLSGHVIDRESPILGFFGDHWQQIYEGTCGSIDHATITAIPKNANFRSDRTIVNLLNGLRPELIQAPAAGVAEGTVTVYHTNDWPGSRLTHNWKGQISHDATQKCLKWINTQSPSSKWIQESKDLKVLMLTHATIANELGYPTLPTVFRYNDSFTRKEDPVIEYLIDTIEPALSAVERRRYGELFDILGDGRRPILHSPVDKLRWNDLFRDLGSTTARGTVGDVLDLLRDQSLVALPSRVLKREQSLADALRSVDPGQDLKEPRNLVEHQKLRAIQYSEIRALGTYLADSTIFSTKHAVKGAEFDDVVVLLGRGWSTYDFAKMLATYPTRNSLNEKDRASFERARNLFYVAVSRAKHNLSLLFTQELDAVALATLNELVGEDHVVSISFSDELTPA